MLEYTAEANHSDNRGRNYGGGRISGWYSKHTPLGYANYEQFRNGNFSKRLRSVLLTVIFG